MKQQPAQARSRASGRSRRLTHRAARKRETHDRILKSAGRIARREGLRAASVPRVMRGAGLTVGGFYAHFRSKDAMDAEMIRTMLGELPGRWLRGLEDAAGLEWLERAVRRYLSTAHRDNDDGCAYPAVLSEVAKAGPDVRRAFADAFELRAAAFAAHAPAVPGATVRERVLATMALTVGGLLLSRATKGDPASEEILAACRKWALPELA
jgi:TetR/AcrR family transcriptional repressor of nem operon